MRLLGIHLVILFCATTLAIDGGNVTNLVLSAIEESKNAYTARMISATQRGAQSSRVRGTKSTPYTNKIGEISDINMNALNILVNRYKVDKGAALELLANQMQNECEEKEITCVTDAKYRNMDGTCNNLENKRWGAANIPFIRLNGLGPDYEGLNDEPRGGKDSSLPNPRKISVLVHTPPQNEDESLDDAVTHMVPQFGQFMDHDITLTPEGGLQCCIDDPSELDDNCFPITVADDDDFFGPINQKCLQFTRSTSYCFPSTPTRRREQFNGITAYIDGSQVYGSDSRVTKMLRQFRGGLMEENSEHKGYLPWTSDVDPGVQNPGRVKAGDVRSDEMPGLAVMHALFLREHNRIAAVLEENTDWSDEIIFQETRRIVTAELQQITYNEFLPVILGDAAMQSHDLILPSTGYTSYKKDVDPSLSNSFSVAAYRFGHTMVNGLIKFLINGNLEHGYAIKDHYFTSDAVVQNTSDGSGYELILSGLLHQNAQAYDAAISDGLTNHLFKTSTADFGSDLAARNIQRGRDHGTPAYHHFREYCNLIALPNSFDGTPPVDISVTNWGKLEQVYDSPQDIDLYTGGLVETATSDAKSGPTFICLMAEQFKKLKDGDRYFFTHESEVGAFTEPQLEELRKRTLGDIICENSNLEATNVNVFLVKTQTNEEVPCTDSRRKLNIELFYQTTSDTTTPEIPTTTASGNNLCLSLWLYFACALILRHIFPKAI